MSYSMFYTADNGVTLGVSADSMIGALSLFSHEFGEAAVHLYTDARAELEKEAFGGESIRDPERKELHERLQGEKRNDGPALDGPGGPQREDLAVRDGADSAGSGGTEGPRVSAGLQDDSSEHVSEGSDGERQPSLLPATETEGEDVGRPADVTRCTVCGDELTHEMERASKLMYGEVRCSDCFAF